MRKESEILLELVKTALWNVKPCTKVLAQVDWGKVIYTAEQQGVQAIAFDGVDFLPVDCRPDLDTLMEWLGQVSYMEAMYDGHKKVITNLAAFYEGLSVKLMVLKGYGLSKNYPNPNHRPVGDIDSYNFGLWKFADQMVHDKLGIAIDNSHHHHTVFNFQGVTIENHYDFLNVHSKKLNKDFEAVLKSLAIKDKAVKDNEISNLYYPCANFNALFIVRHSSGNFCSTGLLLRQVLDWLLFVKEHHDEVDWQFVYSIYKRFNLVRYVNSLNTIGVKYLGFDATIFPEIEKDEKLVDRILADMLEPEYNSKEDGSVSKGVWVKATRWWHNRWKHKITTAEPLWQVFLYGIHSKLMKPAHFKH